MKLIFTRIEISLVVLLTLAFSQILKAQTEEEKTDLAAAIQNPIAAMISVPFQNNTDFGLEPGNQFKNVLNIQPVVPVGLGPKVNMIVRTIIPIISMPGQAVGQGDVRINAWVRIYPRWLDRYHTRVTYTPRLRLSGRHT